MTDPLAAVRSHIDAFNRADVAAVAEGFAEDAVFAAGDDVLIGRRAIAQLFRDAFAAPVEAHLELRQAVTSGDVAACELVERLHVEGDAHEVALAVFYTVRAGRLARVRVYREGMPHV